MLPAVTTPPGTAWRSPRARSRSSRPARGPSLRPAIRSPFAGASRAPGSGRREEARRWTESVMSAVASGARAGTRSPSDALRLRLELEGTDVDLLTLRAARETLGRALATLIAPDSLGASITAIRDTLGLDL